LQLGASVDPFFDFFRDFKMYRVAAPYDSNNASSKCQGVRLSAYSNSEANHALSTFSLAAAFRRATVALRAGAFAFLMAAALPLAAQTSPAKFIPTFLVYYGGGPTLLSSDAANLAKFDLIDIDRFRYLDIGPNTWAAIKAINPNAQIYLYEDGPEVNNQQDSMAQFYLNNLGRYNVSRGHPMGSLNANHPEFFLSDAAGNRIYNTWTSNVSTGQYYYLLDFGSAAYQSYWVTAVKADIANQPWVADGIFADLCVTVPAAGGYNTTSAWYSTDALWSAAMNSFSSGITAGVHAYGQKLWCNKGETRSAAGSAAWLALDSSASPPDVLLEQAAFAVSWGSGAVFFYGESDWKRQIDTMGAVRNSKIALMGHTKLLEGQAGTDNYGMPVTYWQTLWYSLGSFLLGKNDALNNAYFSFTGNGTSYDKIWWNAEYDHIDLGKALGSYTVTTISGVNIYSREFEKGYVYVNPTPANVASVTLPQASQQLTHDNLLWPLSSIPSVNAIALSGHSAAILLKADTTPPTVPTGLTATAVSSTQINLSWNASTDPDSAVTGYWVYLNNVTLARTTGTSFQHTGLTPGTTYNYRVSAYDASGNGSAWTATPVAVTTPVPDTTPPTVPTGLTATAVSSTQINLSWNASTDPDSAVTGYWVYLNNVTLARTTGTSFQHTGLTAGVTYNYRVSAYDASGNGSAWTATPVAVTIPVPDTTPPTVPTGLTATAVSPTQINLSWIASTDNVGVTGYYVYLNDVALARTTGTSFQHTGLSAGVTYNYRVSAYDAAGNGSAWTATPVAVTIPVPDTTPPTVPTGLTGTAVSSSQINLSWNASTDPDSAVTGYWVYLNDVTLARTTGTSFQHTGLTAGVTYNYRVSAYDAAGNGSAWTATPVAVTTPTPVAGTLLAATFTSTLDEIANPERGFAQEWENLSNLDASWLVNLHNAGYRVATHRQLLSAYWNTPTLPQSFLDALNAGAALHRTTGTKMVMQFSYDNVGGLPQPTLTTILGHIAQLKPFFTANADVIISVHGGFLGTYGEWAFSTEPSVGNPTPTAAARVAVRDALLVAVPTSIPIGWRTVNDLKTWYPTPLDASQAFSGSNQARSGIHNDCFLNNPDDAGTYWASGVSDTGRTLSNPFRAYHAQASNWTTTGGENCSDGQYKACSDVLYDGPTYHWRYLRDDWGTVYDDGWKAQGCYPEIKRSLGYRFQLDAVSHSSSAAGGSTLNVQINLHNVGWARIFTARKLVVTLQNTTSGALISGSAGDMRLLPPQATSSTSVVVPVAIPAGTSPGVYAVYVSMPDIWSGTQNKADFAVRFANADNPGSGQAWDAANFRFKTGTTLTVQ
jgi:chitodextrinase